MFRVIFYLLITIFLITIVRGMIGIVLRALSEMISPQAKSPNQARSGPRTEVPLSGELKKDPVCGTYISAASSVKQAFHGETFHFCSAQCRDKYVATAVR